MNLRSAAVLAVVLLAVVWFVASGTRVLNDPQDLRAFYCAGRVVAAHQDPYRAEPLRTCEVGEAVRQGLKPFADLAIPAPLPAYDFAPLAILALLPLANATALYVLLAAATFTAIAAILARLSATPVPVTAIVLSLSAGLIPFLDGQIVSIAILAICCCAYEISRGRTNSACIYAGCACIEPHVALPIWLCLAYALPKTRLPLLGIAATLAALSIALVGLHTTIEYFTIVLPAHARSELAATQQQSLSTLAFLLGANTGVALLAGTCSYGIMSIGGVLLARRLATICAAPELLVLLPPAFAMFGGTFVHPTQIAIAIPASFVLARRLPRARGWLAVALILAALPWRDLVEDAPLPMYAATAIIAIAAAVSVWKLRTAGVAGVAVAALALGWAERRVRDVFERPALDAVPGMHAVNGPHELAQATWTVFATASQHDALPFYFATHLPDWSALAIFVGVTLFTAAERPSLAAGPQPLGDRKLLESS